ncbi:MAG: DNRLRE domain-containing protein [Planctomycetes bacterium]|nr:DNRLRE domain-containing protein [Planctomycetota bacterium]
MKQIASYAGPEDFSWVKRDGYTLPAFKSEKPRFTLWALGDGRKSVMLMAWDESQGTGKGYDTFYFDKNLNADLTEAGERFSAALNEGATFETGAVKEADGARTFSIKYVREKDNFGWQSGFSMGGPNGGYGVGLLPGNLKIRWTEDLKTAPVYRLGGGEPMVFANGKKPGEALGKWASGAMAGVHLDTFICGSDLQNQLKFYHSQVPGAGDPKIMLRVQDAKGAALEDIPFAGGCGCAGSFGQELLVPSRVPPGKHTVAVRVNRAEYMGGAAEYLFPVEIENPDFGKPLVDPAYQALKAKAPSAKIVSLRRASAPGQDGKGYPEEAVVGAQAADDTLYGNTRDWNMSNVNQGGEPFNGLGTQIHHHNDSRTLLKFDLSALPKDAKIAGAQLRITLSNQPFTGTKADAKVQAFAVLKEWIESESCWTAAKKGVSWGAPGCDGAGADRAAEPAGSADIANFPGKDERYRFVAIDLSDLVKQWVSGQQANHGVLLKFAGSGCVTFYSNEFQDYPFRPELLLALDGGGSVQSATAAPAGEDLEAALAAAKKSGRPLAVKFYSPTCGVCKAVERGTFSDADVKKALGEKYQYVSVKIEDRAQLAQDLGVGSVPALVILQADGKTRTAILGSDVLKEKEKVLKALADPVHAPSGG